MRRLENTFSWSSSRDATFRRCPRAYWWQYYGAWGGWEANARPETREAYVLKNLTTRWAWVGSVVHQHIEGILRRIQQTAGGGHLAFHGSAPDVDDEVERLTRRMRVQYAESRGGRYRERPKHVFGLVEHEYGDAVSNDAWRAVNRKACEALRAFLESDLFASIAASDPATWFPIESLDQFDFEGTGVWAVFDFAHRKARDGAVIYDWKTGAVNKEANRLQLACYTLFTEAKYAIAPDRIHNHLVYLRSPLEIHDFVLDEEALEEARQAMRRSIGAMRERLADERANRAEREDFPLTDDRSKCATCNFRRLCGR